MSDTIIDKLLLQAIETNKVKINEYEVSMAQLNTQVDILNKENREYLLKYQELCPHTAEEHVETKGTPGGYDHVSETTYTVSCSRCGKVKRSRLERGTYA